MKKTRKLAAVIMTFAIAVTSVGTLAPMSASAEEEYLLNLDFDSVNDASSVIGLKPNYIWINAGGSQLSYIQEGDDSYIRFTLTEAMNIEGTDKYEIEMRFKMPYLNYRVLALSNGNPDAPGVYAGFAQGLLSLCRYGVPGGNASDMSLDDKTGIGSATSDEWRTVTITYDNGSVNLKVIDEHESGNVENETSTTLAALTGGGNFQHRPGTTYDHLLLGNLQRGEMLSLDYIKVKKSSVAVPRISNVTAMAGNVVQANASVTTTAFQIEFTVPMNETTLANAVTLTDKQGRNIALNGSLSADKKVYTAELGEQLQSSTLYILNVAVSAESEDGTPLAETFKKNLYVSNPNALLEIDFDNNAPALEQLGTGGATPTGDIKTDADGNKYIEIQANFASAGYSMLSGIAKEDREYRVKFDFASKNTRTDYTLMLVDKSTLGAVSDDSHYHQFGLLSAGTSENGVYSTGDTYMKEFRINDTVVPNVEYSEDTWFTYDLTFNPETRAFSLTITEHGNAENTGTLSGTLKDEIYGKGMMSNRTYDAFKIGYNGIVRLDNILIERASGTPIISKSGITFRDKNGNVVTDFNSVSPATTEIVLDFNQSMNVATADGKITLKNKTTGLNENFSISAEGTALILSVANLTPGGYSLTILNGIKSAAGAALEDDFTCDFTVCDVKQTLSLEKAMIGENEVKTLAELADGSASVAINAVNTGTTPENYSVIIAYYNASNKLLGVSEVKTAAAAGFEGGITVPITIAKPEGTTSASIMLWKSATDNTPYSKALYFR